MLHERGNESRFEADVEAWVAGLGKARDAVRQHLVQRQLAVHLAGRPTPLAVLDIGCGQGTQAVGLARAGRILVGRNVSPGLLEQARSLQQAEPADVRGRLRFEHGGLLHLDGRHQGRYDLVRCHGVAMYLPSVAETAAALVGGTRRPGGLVSNLTRNRAGIAMRAGMRRDWTAALASFAARYCTNRLGLESIRADEPAEVQAALAEAGATTIAWYGALLFSDHWDGEDPPSRPRRPPRRRRASRPARPLPGVRRSHSRRRRTGIGRPSRMSRKPIDYRYRWGRQHRLASTK